MTKQSFCVKMSFAVTVSVRFSVVLWPPSVFVVCRMPVVAASFWPKLACSKANIRPKSKVIYLAVRPVAYLGFGKGGWPWRSRRARAYNGGLGVEPPSGSEGRAPGRGVSPPEAEILFACERSIEAANSPIFSEICWKTAKNAPFHIKFPVKNFYGRAKGGASHRAPP